MNSSGMVFQLAVFVAVAFLPPPCFSDPKHYGKFKSNKSRPELVAWNENNFTGFNFYPTSSSKMRDGVVSIYDETKYVLPEPGCSCVPKREQCDFDCCYCELGCPLPKSIESEDWLDTLYGKRCKLRRKLAYKSITFRKRLELASKRPEYDCDRPHHPVNGRMPFFQFFCLKFDNSHYSSHYDIRPATPNLIHLSNMKGPKKFWPAVQRFLIKCDIKDDTILNDALLEPELDSDEVLLRQFSHIFHLEPPLKNITPSWKGQSNLHKVCLGQQLEASEIFHPRLTPSDNPAKQVPVRILEDAIGNLWARKISYVVQFQMEIKQGASSCKQYRQLEPKRLGTNQRLRVSTQNESFQEMCHSIVSGLEVYLYFTDDLLIQMTYQVLTQDRPAVSPAPFFIQIKSSTTKRDNPGKMSRFWSDYYSSECPSQFCWRDVFDFSHLHGDPLSLLLAFISAPSLVLLLFSKVGYGIL